MKIKAKIISVNRYLNDKAQIDIVKELEGIEDYQVIAITQNACSVYTVFYKSSADNDNKIPLIRKTDYDRIYQSRKDILNKEHSVDLGTVDIDPVILKEWREKAEKSTETDNRIEGFKEAEKNEMFARFGIEDIEDLKDTKKLETVGGGRCYEIPTINKKVGGGGLNLTKSFVQMDKEDIAAAIAYLFDYGNSIMSTNPYRTSKISELIVRLRKQIGNDKD